MHTVFIALAIFAFCLVLLIWLRTRSKNQFEIQNTDIVLALVPVALWLFLTGKITEFAFGEVKISAALKVATKAPVGNQVSKVLPIDAVAMYEKGGYEEIPRAISAKSQALIFHLGGRRFHYAGRTVLRYLDELTQYPYLRYVVLNNPDDTFFGMVDARQVAGILRSTERVERSGASPASPVAGEQSTDGSRPAPRLTAQNLADWINNNNTEELKTLPGFIAAKDALDSKADREKALQQMNALDAQTIPVVDASGKFVGVIDRSKLTASILTEVAAKVERSE